MTTLTPKSAPEADALKPAVSGFASKPTAVRAIAGRLHVAGRTGHGHFLLHATSKSLPGRIHDVLVSKDGKRVSCDCAACAFHPQADERGHLTVKVADVRAGRVNRCCWHLRNGARLAPLLVSGYVQTREARA